MSRICSYALGAVALAFAAVAPAAPAVSVPDSIVEPVAVVKHTHRTVKRKTVRHHRHVVRSTSSTSRSTSSAADTTAK